MHQGRQRPGLVATGLLLLTLVGAALPSAVISRSAQAAVRSSPLTATATDPAATAPDRPSVSTKPPAAAAPLTVRASPPGGVFPAAPAVTLAASQPAAIYYTTDGTDPTRSDTRTRYSCPINVSVRTLRFVAIAADGRTSAVVTAVFAITSEPNHPDLSYGGTNAPTAKEEESKLWFHDGSWWGALFAPGGGPSAFFASTPRPSPGPTR
jgi:hypothetical protein